MGPIWGGLLFDALGYIGIFAVQSALLLASAFLVLYFRTYERAISQVMAQEQDALTYCKILKTPVSGF